METNHSETQTLIRLGLRLKEVETSICTNIDCFTNREKEIIKEMANGLTSHEIGGKLFISKSTVDTHRKNIYRKGKFRSIRDVVLFSLFL